MLLRMNIDTSSNTTSSVGSSCGGSLASWETFGSRWNLRASTPSQPLRGLQEAIGDGPSWTDLEIDRSTGSSSSRRTHTRPPDLLFPVSGLSRDLRTYWERQVSDGGGTWHSRYGDESDGSERGGRGRRNAYNLQRSAQRWWFLDGVSRSAFVSPDNNKLKCAQLLLVPRRPPRRFTWASRSCRPKPFQPSHNAFTQGVSTRKRGEIAGVDEPFLKDLEQERKSDLSTAGPQSLQSRIYIATG